MNIREMAEEEWNQLMKDAEPWVPCNGSEIIIPLVTQLEEIWLNDKMNTVKFTAYWTERCRVNAIEEVSA